MTCLRWWTCLSCGCVCFRGYPLFFVFVGGGVGVENPIQFCFLSLLEGALQQKTVWLSNVPKLGKSGFVSSVALVKNLCSNLCLHPQF